MSVLSSHFRETPYWWEAAPPKALPPLDLPSKIDVAIIGGGYTGLSAAITLARNGRSVLVLDAGDPGHAASSRNAGNVSRTLKLSFSEIAAQHGEPVAIACYREARQALEYLFAFIQEERIECHLRRSGRFYAAHSPKAYDRMARSVETLRKHVGYEAEMLSRTEQRKIIGSDAFFGGQLVHGPGLLHGAMYHAGLLQRALAAGVSVAGRTRATAIDRRRDGFTVTTQRGAVNADQVLVASDAEHTPQGGLFSYFFRRIIPVKTYSAATEPIAPDTLKRILPGNQTVVSTHTILYHIQPSPDGECIVFGGRAGRSYDPREAAQELHRYFAERFSDFAPLRVTHCWTGTYAMTFDQLPHIGVQDGVHYVVGLCGTGVPMGTWLGHKAALRIIGSKEAQTAFDGRAFPSHFSYTGRPWFLPALVRYYGVRDALWR